MTVVVFGAGGWLGSRFARFYHERGARVIRSTVDISDSQRVRSILRVSQPDLVVNAAGRTHSKDIPNIDACVASSKAQRETVASNAIGAGVLAMATAEQGCTLVHLSSGCIFDGDGVFDEHATPNPVSFYAQTKVLGEQLVMGANPDALILRIRMPISAQPHQRNLITKLAGALAVIDVVNSVTVVEDLLVFTDGLVQAGVSGVVHAVHPTPVEFKALMAQYRILVDPLHVARFIPKEHYRTADGRSNCVLTSTRELPVSMPDTSVAITRALRGYAEAMVPV